MPSENTDADRSRVDALIEQAVLAFERDAAGLVAEHEGEWVAYHGDRRIGFAKTRVEIWQECLRRGLPEGEFWVFNIQPIIAEEMIGLGGMRQESFDS